VRIYLKEGAKSTKILLNHICKYIGDLAKVMVLKPIYIDKKNVAAAQKIGISRTPTLIYKDKHYVSLEKIVQVLTPPKRAKLGFGLSANSPDELIHSYHDGIMNAQDNDDDDDDPRINRDEDIRRKMAAFQKKRPQMKGVGDEKYIKGGRKVVAKSVKSKFKSDSEFREAAGIDEIKATPSKKYYDDEDGDSILEEYYNSEADKMGRKPNHKPIRWSG